MPRRRRSGGGGDMDSPPRFEPRNSIDRDIAARLLALWHGAHRRWSPAVRDEFKALTPIARVTKGTCRPSKHLIVRKFAPCSSSSSSLLTTAVTAAAANTPASAGGQKAPVAAAPSVVVVPSWAVFLVLVTMFGLQPLMGYGWWGAFRRKHAAALRYDKPAAVPPNAALILAKEEAEAMASAAAAAAAAATATAASPSNEWRDSRRYVLRGSARRNRKIDYRKKSSKSPRKDKEQKQSEQKDGEKGHEKKEDAKTKDEKRKAENANGEKKKSKEKKNKHDDKKHDEKRLKAYNDNDEHQMAGEPKTKKHKKDLKGKCKAEPDDEQDNDVIYISSAESSPVKREPSPRETVDLTMPAARAKSKHSDSKRDKKKRSSEEVGVDEMSTPALPRTEATKHSSSKRDKKKGPDGVNASAGTGGGGETSASLVTRTEAPKQSDSKVDKPNGSKGDKKRGPDAMDVDTKIEGSVKMNAPTLPPTKKPALAGPATASSTTAETQEQHIIGRRAAGSPSRDGPQRPHIQPSRGYEDPRDSRQPRQLESRRSSTSWQAYFPVVRREPQDTPCPRQQHALPPGSTAHPQHSATQAPSRPGASAAPAVPSPADKVWDDLSKLKSSATVTSAAAPTPPAKDEQSVQDLKGQVAQLKKTNRDLWGRIGSLEEKARKQAGEVEVLTGRVQMLAEVVARQARG